ncbi:MAG: NAD-dependent epimerase/dehydratase family protein [Gemmatimonadota bacterium]|nr:MAG: NAD-dependent epimerase/dehydratase family protein [Gemmatimonadota bacterium]
MRVTVTGAAGTIGTASVRMLIRAGHEVRAFVRAAEVFRDRCPEERVEVVEGDILDRAAVATALEDADAAVHCVDFPAREFALSWDATRFALEALGSRGQFVLPSNVWVYGRPQSERIGPDHPKASPARLGEVRADLEKAVAAEGGTVVHLPEVYGPGVTTGRLHRIFQRALAGKTVWFPGDLDRPTEYLYIEDAARALVAPLGRRQARGVDYTAPGPAPTTPREFVDVIFKAAGRARRLRSLPLAWLRAVDALDSERRVLRDFSYLLECSTLLDGTLIRQELGWMPEVGYVEGARRTIRWLRAQSRATEEKRVS